MPPRPARRSTNSPASVVASMSSNADAEPDDRRDQDKGDDFRQRKQQDGDDDPFYHGRFRAVFLPRREVGAGAGIVYGRFEATLPAVSTDAPLYGCSRVPTL